MLIAGRLSWLVVTIIFSAIMLSILYLSSKKIYVPVIREHPGIAAIKDAIGRAAETGRPVSYSPGTDTLYSTKYAADTAAALTILAYVAKESARMGSKLIVGISQPTVLPVAEDVVRTAFTFEGKPEEYVEEETVQFYSPDQWGFSSSYIGMMYREKVAANFLFGEHAAEAMLISENASTIGAIQVAGTTNVYQLPLLLVTCDYCLIGEDEFAAAAYLSPDPVQKGIIFGQDLAKLICIALIVIGSILVTFGNKLISTLLGM